VRRRSLHPLGRDRRGVTVVEFGIIAPVLCLFLAGAFDVAHTLYMKSVLQGIVQKTARDSSLQSNNNATAAATIDARVTKQVTALANNATITFLRRYYKTFSAASAASAEPYTDTDKDKTCDHGEPYTDTNNNGVWDADGGDSTGGAKDRTVYTVTVSYPHMFPMWRFIGLSNTQVLTAQTVLEIQPYDEQTAYATAKTLNCP
jgi:Flp pilus assembly protein TadG